MPDFQPFRGIRYGEQFGADLTALAAPPYDVIDPERRAQLRKLDPHNAVHLTLPGDETSDDEEPGDPYARAGSAFRAWLDESVLAVDDAACFYRYRVEFPDEDGRGRSTTGVIGALEIRPPGSGGVLPHERTMSKPKGDRLHLLRATRANLEPIWGLSLASGLSELLDSEGRCLGRVDDTRGAHHELHAIADADRIAAVRAKIAGAAVVIADGHHRYETSLHYQAECREQGKGEGTHDRILALVVELSEEQLAVQPIHRLIRDLPDGVDLRARLSDLFDVVALGPNEPDVVSAVARQMDDAGAMALVDPDGIALLTARPGALDELLASEPQPVRHVDAARFEVGVAPFLSELGGKVDYRHDRLTVAQLVAKGEVQAALLLRPVDVATIHEVARHGERMPQKTTFFHPKPSTGMVFRSLDIS